MLLQGTQCSIDLEAKVLNILNIPHVMYLKHYKEAALIFTITNCGISVL